MVGAGQDANYLVIIGDIRGSRDIPDRGGLQILMERGLTKINQKFQDDLAAGFVVTLGDEFQGLLLRPEDAVKVLVALDSTLAQDIPMRYGLGWGTVATELRDLAVGMDGPCFHRAREAVQRGKRDDRWATASGFGDDDEIINALLGMAGEVRARWTDVQRETVEQTRTARTQREVAAARGVNESSVSQTLKAALHEPLLAVERAVEQLLGRQGGGGQVGEGTSEEGA